MLIDSSEIAGYFKDLTGVEFHNLTILKSKITIFCKSQKIKTNDLLNYLQRDEEIRQLFINYVTTNETYFFREYSQIETLVKLAFNGMKILCLPCASGEEPYSIAISLVEANITDFTILAIDINDDVLKKAESGIYKTRSVSKLPNKLLTKYFIKDENQYVLDSKIKSFVEFKRFNIFDTKIVGLGKFDYIFSRNMLIYFDKATKIKAQEILYSLSKNQNQPIFFGHADLY
jgi:chemotaxis protein methyltransferase CheR